MEYPPSPLPLLGLHLPAPDNPPRLPEGQRALISESLRAGCGLLCAPTGELNRILCRDPGLDPSALCRAALAAYREAAGRPVGGALTFSGVLLEPFGETEFLDLAGRCAEQAAALQQAGAALLVCHDMPSLGQGRAALLGARQSGLPVWCAVRLDGGGNTLLGSDCLSSLITLQGMGAAAFGLQGEYETMATQLERLRPYADIPLFAVLDASPSCGPGNRAGELLAPDALARRARMLLAAGAAGLAAGTGCTAAHIAALRETLDRFDFSSVSFTRDSHPITAAGEFDSFTLPEGFEFSEPLTCALDMSDAILSAEHDAQDALLVRIDSGDDARSFSLNAHMARLPVAFVSDSEEALEMALAFYSGRAILDARCELPRAVLERLARAYGATVI